MCDHTGLPITLSLSAGQVHESTLLVRVLDTVRVPTGRAPRRRPAKLAGDSAYSSKANRAWLKAHGIKPVIAHRKNESGRTDASFDREAYRDRNVIERCIGWMKEHRRIATRYEKLATNYLGMLKLGMIGQYLKAAWYHSSDTA